MTNRFDANKEHDKLLKCHNILKSVKHNIKNRVVSERSKEELRHISYEVNDVAEWIRKELDKIL